MPLTMLRQMARRSRLEAKLSDDQFNGGSGGQLAKVLQPETAAVRQAAQPLTESEVAKIVAGGTELTPEEYELLLDHQNSKGQLWRSWLELPHPNGSLILPPTVVKQKHFKLGDHTFSCFSTQHNSSGIQFKSPDNPSVRLTGFIQEIWQLPLQNHMQTFFLIRKHKLLPPALLQQTPFPSLSLFQTTAVDAEPSNQFCIIEPTNILTHLTFYHRPKGTYGINKRILVLCWALNRGRRN